MNRGARWVIGGMVGLLLIGGCSAPPPSDEALLGRATQFIRAAARFPDNAAVRAEAMEAVSDVLPAEAGLLLREGLKDEHPGVRFAACMGLGDLADPDARPAVQPLVDDPDGSVRIAAYYALERMGDLTHRTAWRDALLSDHDPVVRRNAALALGRLGNAKVVPLLALASKRDDDEGVRLQAQEAMALLGDVDATSRFFHDAYGGWGYKQPFALMTLGRIKTEKARATLRARVRGAPYLEARLAAARGLGMQGEADGYELAKRSLTWNDPKPDQPDDPPDVQVMRVRSMAALALGSIGRRDALAPLNEVMENSEDPRIQLAAATAILMIIHHQPITSELPGPETR